MLPNDKTTLLVALLTGFSGPQLDGLKTYASLEKGD